MGNLVVWVSIFTDSPLGEKNLSSVSFASRHGVKISTMVISGSLQMSLGLSWEKICLISGADGVFVFKLQWKREVEVTRGQECWGSQWKPIHSFSWYEAEFEWTPCHLQL